MVNVLTRIGSTTENPKYYITDLIVDGKSFASGEKAGLFPFGTNDLSSDHFDFLLYREDVLGVTLGKQKEFMDTHDVKIIVRDRDGKSWIINNCDSKWKAIGNEIIQNATKKLEEAI